MSRETGHVEVREAGVDDVPKIQSVARMTWDHTYRESIPESVRAEFVKQAYSADSLRRRMEPNVFLVAVRREEVLGFADFQPLSDTEAELAAIYVLPEMQGRGIGALLLEAGIGRFSESTSFVLRVERDNARAQRFYEAHGFRRTGVHTDHFFGHVVNEVEMVLEARSGTC
ncbi:MAG TPA: GNAT family N-acetyltransferase [Rubrobacter sp.]|nr:GNAT family N-acetyltransferase [Rubrobacter sp.]